MIFDDYIKSVFSLGDVERLRDKFNEEIRKQQEQLSAFVSKATERVTIIQSYESNRQYVVLGNTSKEGREKSILLIIRYPDGTQRYERYSYNSISEMRTKIKELKINYPVDWSEFEEDVK